MIRFVRAALLYVILFEACFTLVSMISGYGIAVLAVPFVGVMVLSVTLPVYLIVLLYAVINDGRVGRILGVVVGAIVPFLVFFWFTHTPLFSVLLSGSLAGFASIRAAESSRAPDGEPAFVKSA